MNFGDRQSGLMHSQWRCRRKVIRNARNRTIDLGGVEEITRRDRVGFGATGCYISWVFGMEGIKRNQTG